MITRAIELINEERKNQISNYGFSLEKDQELVNSELLFLARYLLFSNEENLPKLERPKHWTRDYIEQFHLLPRTAQLVVAATLIAAEIDRRLVMESKEN